MKRAIVTGAAGFAGINLVERLAANHIFVYAIVRPESKHNVRLKKYDTDKVRLVPLYISDIYKLPEVLPESFGSNYFFHFAWHGKRDDYGEQYTNVDEALKAVEVAARLSIGRFVGVGSQAEYGVKTSIISEDCLPEPFSSYGAAKLAACTLTRDLCGHFNLEWVWGRIFSLIGKYEPAGRMMPDLINALKEGRSIHLSSCRQFWDYLDAGDCGDAFIALAEKGQSGNIYNVANGAYRPLKEYIARAAAFVGSEETVEYGKDPEPFVSLKPSVKKLYNDTGWKANITFEESLKEYYM